MAFEGKACIRPLRTNVATEGGRQNGLQRRLHEFAKKTYDYKKRNNMRKVPEDTPGHDS